MEIRLLKAAMELKKPILGICRGIQLLNVALGGTIYQDIPSQMERTFPLAHKQPFYYTVPSHHVDIKGEAFCQRLPAAWSVFLSTASIIRPLRMLLRALYL